MNESNLDWHSIVNACVQDTIRRDNLWATWWHWFDHFEIMLSVCIGEGHVTFEITYRKDSPLYKECVYSAITRAENCLSDVEVITRAIGIRRSKAGT
jgi:hypothetical protein